LRWGVGVILKRRTFWAGRLIWVVFDHFFAALALLMS
jgi:hypothetical protein